METDNKIILARRAKMLLDEEAKYILFAEGSANAIFRMSVEYGGEGATCDLGTSAESALATFLLIFGGGVTPCTLKDVINDINCK